MENAFLFEIIIVAGFLIFGIGYLVWMQRLRNSERVSWNRGICRETMKPWVYFRSDVTGSRGYTDSEGHYVWIRSDIDEENKT